MNTRISRCNYSHGIHSRRLNQMLNSDKFPPVTHLLDLTDWGKSLVLYIRRSQDGDDAYARGIHSCYRQDLSARINVRIPVYHGRHNRLIVPALPYLATGLDLDALSACLFNQRTALLE